MNYLFKCPACNGTVEIDISINEYSEQKDKQICTCGNKLVRVLEWTGIATGSGEGWCGARGGTTI